MILRTVFAPKQAIKNLDGTQEAPPFSDNYTATIIKYHEPPPTWVTLVFSSFSSSVESVGILSLHVPVLFNHHTKGVKVLRNGSRASSTQCALGHIENRKPESDPPPE